MMETEMTKEEQGKTTGGRVKLSVRVKWTEEIKHTLMKIQEEVRNDARDMKKMKEKWDEEKPEYHQIPLHTLKVNARRFEKEREEVERTKTANSNSRVGESSNGDGESSDMVWSKLWKERLIQLICEVEEMKPKSKMAALKELWDQRYPHLQNITRQALWASGRKFQKKGATSPLRAKRVAKDEENQEEGNVDLNETGTPAISVERMAEMLPFN
jgi:hypothetical protein